MNLFNIFKAIRKPKSSVDVLPKESISRGGSMKTTDLVFIDIETTGLDPHKNEIIEVAALRVQQDWSNPESPVFTELGSYTAKIKPIHLEHADPVALRVNGYIASEWKNAVPLSEALTELMRLANGAIMVAHNVAFDSEFLNAKFAELGIVNTMHYHRIDTVSMAYAVLRNTPKVERYSLVELCKYFGIDYMNAHSAMPDVYADFALFKKLVS